MILLSLDPSSKVTGYAVIEAETERLVEQGRLVGKPVRADADTRVRSMLADIGPLLRDIEPGGILVEVPLEKQYTRTKGKQSGMAVWAMAAGRVLGYIEGLCVTMDDPPAVVPVSNTQWTRELKMNKESRQDMVACLFSQYEPRADPGLDVSDAIAMALWFIRRRDDKLAAEGP